MPAKLRLYYFTTERYALEAIRDQRLKIARLNELNDPFEFCRQAGSSAAETVA